jgi:hypothetical protein
MDFLFGTPVNFLLPHCQQPRRPLATWWTLTCRRGVWRMSANSDAASTGTLYGEGELHTDLATPTVEISPSLCSSASSQAQQTISVGGAGKRPVVETAICRQRYEAPASAASRCVVHLTIVAGTPSVAAAPTTPTQAKPALLVP